jgi:hypothetical protein
MRLRGYEGRLRAALPRSANRAFDAVLIVAALGVLGLALTFRLAGAGLTPYSWLPTAAALIVCIATVVWRLK